MIPVCMVDKIFKQKIKLTQAKFDIVWYLQPSHSLKLDFRILEHFLVCHFTNLHNNNQEIAERERQCGRFRVKLVSWLA